MTIYAAGAQLEQGDQQCCHQERDEKVRCLSGAGGEWNNHNTETQK